MGAIEKFVKNTATRAIDSVQNFGDSCKAALNKVYGYMGSALEVAKNGESFVGLKYSSIESIRTAIRQYVKGIQDVVDNMNTDLNPDNAVKGETAAACKAYVKAVGDVAKAYVSSLLAYSDKMYEYGEAYKASDTNVSSSLNEEASAMSASAGETYVEKY